MSIALIDATEEQHGGFIDRLGYAVCIDCHGETRPGSKWAAASNLSGTVDDPCAPGECFRCENPFVDCTPMVIKGVAIIESVTCKIF